MKRCALMIGLGLWVSAGLNDACGLTVDDFSVGSLVFNVAAGQHYPTSTQASLDAEHVLGGVRISTLFASRTIGNASIEVDTTGSGVLEFNGTNDLSNGEGVSLQYGVSNVTVYASPDNPLDLDLTAFADGAIELSFLSYEPPATSRTLGASIQLYSEREDGIRLDSYGHFHQFGASATPFKVRFNLAAFIDAPLDDIDGMTILVGTVPGTRLAIDSISIVPEPRGATLGAVCVMLSVAVPGRWRGPSVKYVGR